MNPKGTLSIQLLDFNNPSGKDYSGSCCDCCGAFGWCPNDCENFFQIFVASYPLSIFSFFHAWKRWETYVLGDDSFTFPGYGHIIGKDGLRNPLTYHFDGPWPVRYSLSVFLNCLTFYGISLTSAMYIYYICCYPHLWHHQATNLVHCFDCFPKGGVGGTCGNSWWGCAARFSKSWPDFRPKNVIFHTRFLTRPLKSIPVFRPGL